MLVQLNPGVTNSSVCYYKLYLDVTNNNKNNRRVYLYHAIMMISIFDLNTKRNGSVAIFSHHVCKGIFSVDSFISLFKSST